MDLLTTKVGIGLTGRVAATGESLLLEDAANYEHARQLPGTEPIDESIIAVPLSYGTRVIGVIVLSKLGLNQFDDDDVRLLEVLAGHASVALENAKLYEAARREAERATALLEFSRELATAAGIDDGVDRIVELSARTIGSRRASVWLQGAAGEDLVARAIWGYSELDESRLARLAFGPADVREFFAGKEPFVVDSEQHAQIEGAAEILVGNAFAIAPIELDAGRLGCIAVAVPEEGEFTDRHLGLLAGVAHQAKLALTNAASFHSLETTFLETVEALANALEANDEYTSSHARWITDLALKVGKGLGLDAQQLKRLELGADSTRPRGRSSIRAWSRSASRCLPSSTTLFASRRISSPHGGAHVRERGEALLPATHRRGDSARRGDVSNRRSRVRGRTELRRVAAAPP